MNQPLTTASRHMQAAWGHALEAVLCTIAMLVLPTTSRAVTVVGEPDAYLDYIESTGEQYIDTGVNAETGLKARLDMEWGAVVKPLSAGGDDWSMLDARKTGGDTRFYLCHLAKNANATAFIFGYGYNTWHRTATSPERQVRHEVLADFSDQAALSARINGKEMLDAGQRTGHAGETVDLQLNLYPFACNYNGTASYPANARLYECKIFKKNAATGGFDLERHFIPARKNGYVGLYDKAGGIFYSSDSGTEFIAGAELPRPAAMVEWVEADGSTSSSVAQQYVDTGVWGKLGLRSRVDVALRENSGDHAILAARGAVSISNDLRLYMAYHYNKYFCYGDGKLREPKNLAPTNGVRYVFESDLSAASQSVTVNGTELNNGSFTGTTQFTTDCTLALFANNHKGAYVKNPTHSRLYSAKIWDGDELLRDFAPCVADDGEAGLYDAVSGRVFKPIGKAFNPDSQVGGVTNVLAEVAPPKIRLEYVDSDGSSDYVDLGVIARDGVAMDAVMEWLTVPSDGAFVGARRNDQTNNRGTAGVRFFPYHHWNGHRIGYSAELPGLYENADFEHPLTAVAGIKYKIASRLDNADQEYVVDSGDNGRWTAVSRSNSAYPGPVNTDLSLYLFAIDLDGTPKYFGHSRVYSLKLSEKQQDGSYALVRNLIPVRDPLTGGAALWDRVNEKYYRNASKFRLLGGGQERAMVLPFLMVVR